MKMLIGGEWRDAADGAVMEIRNPATGELVDAVPAAGEADTLAAVQFAQEGRQAMAATPAHLRHNALMSVAARIERDAEDLATLLARENGKTRREIRGEIAAAVRIFRGYAEEAKRLFGRITPLDTIPGLEDGIALTTRVPRGVVVAIVPFNYPVELWAHKGAGALAAGNALITKPPEECPLTLLRISGYLAETGLPPKAHQVVTGVGETVGAALVRAAGVQMVTMTGSTATGRTIAAAAAETLKKVHLELGGNDATILCADTDPAAAARALVKGRFSSGNGQICCAVKRVFVQRAIYDAVCAAVLRETATLKIGDPLDETTDVGPLITERAAQRVEQQIAQGVNEGASLVAGGRRDGNFIAPAVFTGVRADMAVFREEIFGPVLPLVPFDSIDDAFAMVNDSPYGLQAAVFTQDLATVMSAYRRLDVGTVVVNHPTSIRVESLPFGGAKGSGNAREGIHDTLLDMTEARTLLIRHAFAGSAEAAA